MYGRFRAEDYAGIYHNKSDTEKIVLYTGNVLGEHLKYVNIAETHTQAVTARKRRTCNVVGIRRRSGMTS